MSTTITDPAIIPIIAQSIGFESSTFESSFNVESITTVLSDPSA